MVVSVNILHMPHTCIHKAFLLYYYIHLTLSQTRLVYPPDTHCSCRQIIEDLVEDRLVYRSFAALNKLSSWSIQSLLFMQLQLAGH